MLNFHFKVENTLNSNNRSHRIFPQNKLRIKESQAGFVPKLKPRLQAAQKHIETDLILAMWQSDS